MASPLAPALSGGCPLTVWTFSLFPSAGGRAGPEHEWPSGAVWGGADGGAAEGAPLLPPSRGPGGAVGQTLTASVNPQPRKLSTVCFRGGSEFEKGLRVRMRVGVRVVWGGRAGVRAWEDGLLSALGQVRRALGKPQ